MMKFENNFPFFAKNSKINYLDSAATTQVLYTVPQDRYEFEIQHRSNAHRSGHKLGTWVDQQYHQAKQNIAEWLNVSSDQIVFNSGTTQGLYDSAKLIGRRYPRATVYLGEDSHHSLFLPFNQLSQESPNISVLLIKTTKEGLLDLDNLESRLESLRNNKVVIAVNAVSNVLGKLNDLNRIRDIAKKYNAITVVDASQLVGKRRCDLTGFDFVAFSWHKIYGPMGLGCLIVDEDWLDSDPVRPGGGSITQVSYNHVDWQVGAGRFESGTQNLSAIVAIPKLVDWIRSYEQEIEEHDITLARYAASHCPGDMFKPISFSDTGLISIQPRIGTVEDYAYMLDAKNIMVRSGKLCAEPLVSQHGSGLIRLSWACYTSKRDLEQAFNTLMEIYEKLRRHVSRAA
jgi:selenocysteine lyase/cysteine desulfurase